MTRAWPAHDLQYRKHTLLSNKEPNRKEGPNNRTVSNVHDVARLSTSHDKKIQRFIVFILENICNS